MNSPNRTAGEANGALPDGGGKTDAFVADLTGHQRPLLAFIRSLIPTHPDPEDILQEVNMVLWQKRADFEPGTNFKAWAFKVARYKVLQAWRTLAAERGRHVFTEQLIEKLSSGAEFVEEPFDDRLKALQRCLQKVRQKDRQLLEVCYSGKTTIAAYAASQKRNAGTVRATLRRIRNALQKCIRGELLTMGARAR